jgi:hypothetical protein
MTAEFRMATSRTSTPQSDRITHVVAMALKIESATKLS